MAILIEACVDSVESAIAAEKGGADRIELNIALELDGLTPSVGLFEEVKRHCSLPVITMIRPRSNGFIYSRSEFATMQRDIDSFLNLGANGIAIGILREDYSIDDARLKEVVKQAGTMDVVVHRAFDITPDMHEALEILIDCGVKRVLTSGQAPTALAGAKELAKLIEQAGDRIEILPGCGVNPANVASLVESTGCRQVHGTFKKPGAFSQNPMGLDRLRAPSPPGTDAQVVARVFAELNGY